MPTGFALHTLNMHRDDTNCALSPDCPRCVLAKKGPTCCGEGGAWEGTCGKSIKGNSNHTWNEGYRACESKTVKPTTLKPAMTTSKSATVVTKAAPLPSTCESERVPWQVLGYTQASWDNAFGDAQQPWSSIKYWSSLTPNEKAAAEVLGYNETTWDNDSGFEPQPASVAKSWAGLTACADGEITVNNVLACLTNLFAGEIYWLSEMKTIWSLIYVLSS